VNLIIYALELFPHWADFGAALRIIAGLLLPHSALISSLSHFSGTAVYNSVCKNIPPLVKEFTCNQGLLGIIYPAAMCCGTNLTQFNPREGNYNFCNIFYRKFVQKEWQLL
jgi:hypothetical protein